MLKVLKAWLQQYVSQELPDVQAGLEKGEEPEIANIHWIIKKARESHKTFLSASLTMLKLFSVWTTTNCGTFLRKC